MGSQPSNDMEYSKSRGNIFAVIAGVAVVGVVLFAIFVEDPFQNIDFDPPEPEPEIEEINNPVENYPNAGYLKLLFKTSEEVWKKIFLEELQLEYKQPTLVIFVGN